MAKAIVSMNAKGLTCELKVRFHHVVRPGDDVRIEGWIVERKRRIVRAEASICNCLGEEMVHASATFLVVKGANGDRAW